MEFDYIKKMYENRTPLISIDTLKISINKDVYNEVKKLFTHNVDEFNNCFTIKNSIFLKRVMCKDKVFTHITFYGLRSHILKKDYEREILFDKVLQYLSNNISSNNIFIKQLDIAVDYYMKPQSIFIYNQYIKGSNKAIKLNKLEDSDNETESLYIHDFKYYRANLYVLNNDIFSIGIPFYDDIKKELENEFNLYCSTNNIRQTKKSFCTFIQNKYYEESKEFIKYENNNYYLYIPRKLYESNDYISIKHQYQLLGLKFKPKTFKSHVIKYNKTKKIQKYDKSFKEIITRVEFVNKFYKKTYIHDVNEILKKIDLEINKIYICTYKIEVTSYNAFLKIYNNQNSWGLKEKLIVRDRVLNILNRFSNK